MLVYKRVPYDRSLKLVKKMVAGERRSSTWKRGQGERCWHHQPPSGILISFFAQNQAQTQPGAVSSVADGTQKVFLEPLTIPDIPVIPGIQSGSASRRCWWSPPIDCLQFRWSIPLAYFGLKLEETLIFMGKKNTAGFWRCSKKQIEYIQKNKMTSSKPTFFLRARCPIGLGSLTSNLCSVLCKLNLRR